MSDELGLSQLKQQNDRPANVYVALIRHQQEEEWDAAPIMQWLYAWSRRFILEFDLDIPIPPIAVDGLRSKTHMAHFRRSHNCWGLEGEIKISRKHLEEARGKDEDRSYDVLGSLLHELLHAWQHQHGRPGRPPYHNGEFQVKAASLGLIVDGRGRQSYAMGKQPDENGIIGFDGLDPEAPFRRVMEKYGINMPAIPRPRIEEKKGRKRPCLTPWVCTGGCRRRIWASREDCPVICGPCGKSYIKAEPG